ncbi:rhomboid family intramembrane serine protease [Fulvivirga sedimenti]|uniref:Rhomboid family intramembrane serine protease n=1 Tax=Fulvivirga sedimenti TaxID=2879465 RepID=A0A9X1HSG5_9BACT|nr:rhomboid family intramembrane serine protease [Fulvivirga sedimenti]MCA6075569.1 rhomboid family intramembrane serine protease [Fulvivirga sedimenti]MCA6076746.1 rhomboid family intramembrane serine protease [Fulvivirga sedimenti]MCA6077874.1 rhomboid family intramembrane serine protease [Fulvivirga sedimenti]
MMRLTPVVKNLLIINVVVFLLQIMVKSVDVTGFLALHRLTSPDFRPYQFFTYMFAHGDFGHIIFNMLGLVFLGPLLEQFWGPKKFITFYLVTGVGAALLYTGMEVFELRNLRNDVETYLEAPTPDNFAIFVDENDRYFNSGVYEFQDQFSKNANDQQYIEQSKMYVQGLYNEVSQRGSMLGASGAIYGILMAFGLLFPNTQLMLLIPPIPVKAKYLVLFLGAYAVWAGFARNPGDPVAHFAHLGGMVFAFIMIKYWQTKRDSFY